MQSIPKDREKLSPMMAQYLNIKDKHKDHILFFRLGDFYEMFFDDALLASKELEITLTGRDCGLEERAPMCGVPYHSVESYIARLIKKGYKVAICEQMENPAEAKGVVKREIIRVITPGTLMESGMLNEGVNNYICCIYMGDGGYGLSFADISTGEIDVTQLSEDDAALINELGKFSPSEIIYNSDFVQKKDIGRFIKDYISCTADKIDDEKFSPMMSETIVCRQFAVKELSELSLDDQPIAVRSLGGLLSYLEETQRGGLERLKKVNLYRQEQFMHLDVSARRNLEITETMRSREKRGSLLWTLDRTKTSMGRRMMRANLERPLVSITEITKRQAAVSELYSNSILVSRLQAQLCGVYDLERLMTRVVYGNCSPNDLTSLGTTAECLPDIKELISESKSSALQEIYADTDTLSDIAELVAAAIDPKSKKPLKEGGVIREGFNAKLDELRILADNTWSVISSLEEEERIKTGIKGLKIGYNKVFGYYIEISRTYTGEVPDSYIRKQTLTGTERYITEELKELEERMISARQDIITIAAQIFEEVRAKIALELDRVQKTASAISRLDFFCSLASVALSNHYCCPTVDLSNDIIIKDGRHPVVEKMLTDSPFVPNDTKLNCSSDQIAIITGPNMAGKSTYMRQNALIVLMAQIGSFVPASEAKIGIVDGIYTRVGASDDLSSGQSTFMVEMSEVASILKNATSKSLLILDEIGRGTSTFDGMSIARAVIEYIADKKTLGAKTLFATHYHELTELESIIPCVKNYNIAVKKRGREITFLRRIIPGGADESYGIEVSKIAGIPDKVVERAFEIIKSFENGTQIKNARIKTEAKMPEPEGTQLQLEDRSAEIIKRRLRQTDLDSLTPIEALNLIYELKKTL